MTEADRFNLERFITAQAPVFETVLAELRAGRKRTHWMWFIFPQLAGLGRSSAARFYGIGSLEEARAYWLGQRTWPWPRPVSGIRVAEGLFPVDRDECAPEGGDHGGHETGSRQNR